MGRKVGAVVPLFGGRDGSPFNTVSPGPRPTSVPSDILIQPAFWLQQTWAVPLWEGELGTQPFWGGCWVPI